MSARPKLNQSQRLLLQTLKRIGPATALRIQNETNRTIRSEMFLTRQIAYLLKVLKAYGLVETETIFIHRPSEGGYRKATRYSLTILGESEQ